MLLKVHPKLELELQLNTIVIEAKEEVNKEQIKYHFTDYCNQPISIKDDIIGDLTKYRRYNVT